MIHNLSIIFIRADAYTAIVAGNAGARELIISASPAHDGRTCLSLTIAATGGQILRLDPRARYLQGACRGFPLVRTTDLEEAIRNALYDFAHCDGIEPNQEQREHLLETTWSLSHRIVDVWGIHDAAEALEALEERERAHPYQH